MLMRLFELIHDLVKISTRWKFTELPGVLLIKFGTIGCSSGEKQVE